MESVVEVETKVGVIAPVQLIAAGPVRSGQDAPVLGETPAFTDSMAGRHRPLLHAACQRAKHVMCRLALDWAVKNRLI